MKVLIALSASLIATAAFAHEAPKTQKPAKPAVAERPVLKTAPKPAPGHGGGLDASGCHMNHSTGVYHCHR